MGIRIVQKAYNAKEAESFKKEDNDKTIPVKKIDASLAWNLDFERGSNWKK